MIRLFNKHELSLSYNSHNKYFDKLRQQYDYAKDNVDSIKKVVNSDASSGGKSTAESVTNAIISKLFDFVKRILYLGAAFIIFTMVFRNVRILLVTLLV